MESFRALAIVGLLAVGCGGGADPDTSSQTQGKATTDTGNQKKTPAPRGEALEENPAPDPSGYSNADAGGSRTVECIGQNGDSASVTRFTMKTGSGVVTSLTVTMTNAEHANKNAILISLRGPTDHLFAAAFRSESNINDGATVAVPFPSGFTIPPNGSIQVETTFSSASSSAATTGVCRVELGL